METKFDLMAYVIPAGIIILALVLGIIFKKTVLQRFARYSEKTKIKVDDIIIGSISSVVILWFLLFSLFWKTEGQHQPAAEA